MHKHALYDNIDALLSPGTLSEIAQERVVSVHIEPLVSALSASGNRFLAVKTRGVRDGRYVVKRLNWDWDWLMQASDDRGCREVRLWLSGFLDRLPGEIIHPVLACARDGDGYAMLMSDQSVPLAAGQTLDEATHRRYLNALAALHAHYLRDPPLADFIPGQCDPDRYISFMSPQRLATITDCEMTRAFIRFWECVDAHYAPEVSRITKRLHADPAPMCAALQQFPQVLTHGDWAPRNLGIAPGVVLAIDWQFCQVTAPALDLLRYLIEHIPEWPISMEEAIHYYRVCFEQHAETALDDRIWEAQVELGALALFLRLGGVWTYQWEQRGQLDVLPWIERKVLAGAARL